MTPEQAVEESAARIQAQNPGAEKILIPRGDLKPDLSLILRIFPGDHVSIVNLLTGAEPTDDELLRVTPVGLERAGEAILALLQRRRFLGYKDQPPGEA